MTQTNRFPEYATKLFVDIYDNVNDFIHDYQTIGFATKITEDSCRTLYYLLYAKYGNNPIANYDETQWKYKLFSLVYMYGPAWEKRLEIQDKIRELTDDELISGTKQIFNKAYNPSTEPTTTTIDELDYISEQNTSGIKRGKLDAYGAQWDLLATDVTNDFLSKFTVLFKKFVRPSNEMIFETILGDFVND